jgi:hypothetical protein
VTVRGFTTSQSSRLPNRQSSESDGLTVIFLVW